MITRAQADLAFQIAITHGLKISEAVATSNATLATVDALSELKAPAAPPLPEASEEVEQAIKAHAAAIYEAEITARAAHDFQRGVQDRYVSAVIASAADWINGIATRFDATWKLFGQDANRYSGELSDLFTARMQVGSLLGESADRLGRAAAVLAVAAPDPNWSSARWATVNEEIFHWDKAASPTEKWRLLPSEWPVSMARAGQQQTRAAGLAEHREIVFV